MQQTASTDQSVQHKEMLIIVFDLINYVPFRKQNEGAEVFRVLNEFYSKSKINIQNSGGKLIKFIGDTGIAVYEKDQTDIGVNSMMKLKIEIDEWFSKHVPNGGLAVNCHVGEVTIGDMVGSSENQTDVIGEAVNIAFTLGKRQFLISPQAFRSLSSQSRTNFKKFTPPIVYKLTAENDH